jgi:hypothetical protein
MLAITTLFLIVLHLILHYKGNNSNSNYSNIPLENKKEKERIGMQLNDID